MRVEQHIDDPKLKKKNIKFKVENIGRIHENRELVKLHARYSNEKRKSKEHTIDSRGLSAVSSVALIDRLPFSNK